ncbi:MAG: hypothetical protein ACXAC8_08895 [Candidatus Hodarchaeales archaeon]|jgi:hypothetical protein
MTWKHILGKPGNTYIIGKHWVKKNIPKSKRLPKSSYKTICPDYIYNIGFHFLPDDPTNPQELWVCLKTGDLFTKNDFLTWLKESRLKLKKNHVKVQKE